MKFRPVMAALAALIVGSVVVAGAQAAQSRNAVNAADGYCPAGQRWLQPDTRVQYDAGVLDCDIPQDLRRYAATAYGNHDMLLGHTNPREALDWMPTAGCAFGELDALTAESLKRIGSAASVFDTSVPYKSDAGELVAPYMEVVSLGEVIRGDDWHGRNPGPTFWQVDPTVKVFTTTGTYTVHFYEQFEARAAGNDRGYTLTWCSSGFLGITLA